MHDDDDDCDSGVLILRDGAHLDGGMSHAEGHEHSRDGAAIDEAGLCELFDLVESENDDPLGLLYLEPGSIEPAVAAAAAVQVEQPRSDHSAACSREESAASQLRELSVLCGEDADEICHDLLAPGTPVAMRARAFAP